MRHTHTRPAPGWATLGLLALLTTGIAAGAARQGDAPPQPPLGLPPVQWPVDNPYSKAKWEL